MLVAYSLYYVWDGKRDEQPWWVVLPLPLKEGGVEWVVLEAAEMDDVHDTDAFMKAIHEALPLSDTWLDNDCYHVRRSRWEALQHAVLGTDRLPREREAIKEVTRRIACPES